MTDPDPKPVDLPSEPAPKAHGLTVGFVPGVTVTKWRRVWFERFPRTPLAVVEVAQREQREAIDNGRVDMCFVRLPLIDEGLHVIPLYQEVPVVVVPKDHPISLFEKVTLTELTELTDENVLDGDDITEGNADGFDLVAGGAGVLLVPHSIARSRSRRDLVYRPISDAPETQVSLAWRRDDLNKLIQDFIGIVRGRTVNSSRSARPEPEAKAKPRPPAKPQAARGQPARRRRGR